MIDGLMVFLIIIIVVGVILYMTALCGGFSGATHDVENIPQHNYTEQEFINLFNYCARKRNAKLNETNSIIRNQKITNMDKILDYCDLQYKNPYNTPDYNDLCLKLLSLLDREEQIKINYGIKRVKEDK